MKISGAIEPAFIVEPRRVDHQRFVFPSARGIPHPGVDLRLDFDVHVRDAAGIRVRIREQHVRRRLHDLERVRHVGRPWNSGQVTFDFRVQLHPLVRVGFLFCQRRGPVGNLVADDNAFAGRNAESCSQLQHRTLSLIVILDVPIGGIHRLPDAVQIRLAVCGPRGAVGGLLAS